MILPLPYECIYSQTNLNFNIVNLFFPFSKLTPPFNSLNVAIHTGFLHTPLSDINFDTPHTNVYNKCIHLYAITFSKGGTFMRSEHRRGHHKERYLKEDGHRRGRRRERGGAQTYRLGRVITFLNTLETQRDILKKQLTSPELQSVNPVIAGELKAVEAIIEQYIQTFELYDDEKFEDEVE